MPLYNRTWGMPLYNRTWGMPLYNQTWGMPLYNRTWGMLCSLINEWLLKITPPVADFIDKSDISLNLD